MEARLVNADGTETESSSSPVQQPMTVVGRVALHLGCLSWSQTSHRSWMEEFLASWSWSWTGGGGIGRG